VSTAAFIIATGTGCRSTMRVKILMNGKIHVREKCRGEDRYS